MKKRDLRKKKILIESRIENDKRRSKKEICETRRTGHVRNTKEPCKNMGQHEK